MESRQGLVNTLQTIPVSLFFCHAIYQLNNVKRKHAWIFFVKKTLVPIAVNGIHHLEEPQERIA